ANTLVRGQGRAMRGVGPDWQYAITASRPPPASAAASQTSPPAGWHLYHTDAPAAVQSLRAHLPPGPGRTPSPLETRSVLLLGAGGVARAVAHGLHREGAVVTIANRTLDKAQKLAEDVGCRAIDWGARHSVLCDTLVNCTSVGMHPNMDES